MASSYPFDTLPTVSRQELFIMRSLRRCLGLGAQAAFVKWAEACLDTADVEISYSALWADPLPDAVATRVSHANEFHFLGPAGATLRLYFDPAGVRSVAHRVVRASDKRASTQPNAAQEGIWTFALAWLLSTFDTLASWRLVATPRPLSAESSERTNPQPVVIEFICRIESRSYLGWIAAPPELWTALPPSSNNSSLARAEWLAAIEITLAIELTSCVLAFPEVSILAPGDVIVGLRCAPPTVGTLVAIRGAGGQFSANVSAEQVDPSTGERCLKMLLNGPFQGGDMRSDSDEQREADVDQGDQDNLPQANPGPSDDLETVENAIQVRLAVEIGRVTLPATELMELGSGDVITLERPLGSPVDLRVSGRLIGQGELVNVDGETGVRITKAFS